MRERILVPLDGSKTGEAALPYVTELVSKLAPTVEVEIIMLQVLASMSHIVVAGEASAQVPFTEQEMAAFKDKAMEYLEQAGDSLRKNGVKVKTLVVIGNAAEEIIKGADEMDVDLIAMSTHGRSGISRWAFGSVTDRVLRGGHKPVLIVRVPRPLAT